MEERNGIHPQAPPNEAPSDIAIRCDMCDLDKLKMLLERRLDLEEDLELFDHLDKCESCRMAIYSLSRDRDKAYLIYRPYRIKPPRRKKLPAA